MTKAIYITDKLPGTREIVDALLEDSNPSPGRGPAWGIVRGGALKAIALTKAPADHVWMTTAEFKQFLSDQWLDRRGGLLTLAEQVGMGVRRRDKILAGDPITMVEALACAHYALRLPLPVEVANTIQFEKFITKHFGRPVGLAKALGIRAQFIRDRMDGFQTVAGKRVPRAPDVDLIRACDWVRRMGPYSPFGADLPYTWETA